MTYSMSPWNGKLRLNPQIIQTAPNNYDVVLGAQTQLERISNLKGAPDPSTFTETIHIGNPSVVTSHTPIISIPRWDECGISIQMVGPNALFSTSVTDGTQITASNASIQLTHAPVGLRPGFNEWGGLEHTTTLLKSVGKTLTYMMTLTNVVAYLQPSFTKEWTVGQVLKNGNTVATVTDTDVTDNLGHNVAHRPIYVVNAIAFYHTSKGGIVPDTDATRGLTTGLIGMLYARVATDNSPIPQTGYTAWSFSGNTLVETLPVFTNPVYPIVLAPAGDTFGYTTAGSSSSNNLADSNHLVASYLYTGAAGTGTSMSLYASGSSNGMALALYTSGGVEVANSPTTTDNPSAAQWYLETNSPSLSAISYYLCFWGDSGWSNNGYVYYNSGGSHYFYAAVASYISYPGTATFLQQASLGYIFPSVFVTYTPGGGGGGPIAGIPLGFYSQHY
jgi:hypothetical protein